MPPSKRSSARGELSWRACCAWASLSGRRTRGSEGDDGPARDLRSTTAITTRPLRIWCDQPSGSSRRTRKFDASVVACAPWPVSPKYHVCHPRGSAANSAGATTSAEAANTATNTLPAQRAVRRARLRLDEGLDPRRLRRHPAHPRVLLEARRPRGHDL